MVAAPVSMRERGARPAAAGPVRSLRTCRVARSAGQPSCQQRPRRPVARVPGSPAELPTAQGSRATPPTGLSFFIQLDFQFVSEANVKGGALHWPEKEEPRPRAHESSRAGLGVSRWCESRPGTTAMGHCAQADRQAPLFS